MGSEGRGSRDGSLLRSGDIDCGESNDEIGGKGVEIKLGAVGVTDGNGGKCVGGVPGAGRGGKSFSSYTNGGGPLCGTLFGIHSLATPSQNKSSGVAGGVSDRNLK